MLLLALALARHFMIIAVSSFAPAYALNTPSDDGEVDLTWLEDSHKRPQLFLADLCERVQAHAQTPLKSRPPERGPQGYSVGYDVGYDLYHDMILRHRGSDRIAWRSYRRPRGWQSLSFQGLDARVRQRAASWRQHGVQTGDVVAIVMPFGLECTISLLAAIRLGACASFIPPRGRDYVAACLAAASAAHIAIDTTNATGNRHRGYVAAYEGLILPADSPTATTRVDSHWAAGDEVVAVLFSPLREPWDAPIPLLAADAFAGALCTGQAVLALRPGDHVAAPGFDPVQHQPCLLFAALLAGAAWVEVDTADVVRDPALLDKHPLRSLGVSPAVRDALGTQRHRGRFQHWFRNPEEPTDWSMWRDFIQRCQLGDTPMSNVVCEAAAGGALLSSPRRSGDEQLRYFMNVTPAPGQPWTLLDFTGTGQRAVGDAGVFARIQPDPKTDPPAEPQPDTENAADTEAEPLAPNYMVLARLGSGEHMYANTIEARRAGRVYPAAAVEAAVADLAFVVGACTVAVLSGGSAVHYRFVLLIFTGTDLPAAADKAKAARGAIAERMGTIYAPDHIECVPLYPRYIEDTGEINGDYCRRQYLSGMLFRKRAHPIFRALTELRSAIAGAAIAAAAAEGEADAADAAEETDNGH